MAVRLWHDDEDDDDDDDADDDADKNDDDFIYYFDSKCIYLLWFYLRRIPVPLTLCCSMVCPLVRAGNGKGRGPSRMGWGSNSAKSKYIE